VSQDDSAVITQAVEHGLSGSLVGTVRERQSGAPLDDIDNLIARRSGETLDNYGRRRANEEERQWRETEERHNHKLKVEAQHHRLLFARHLRGVYAQKFKEYSRLVRALEGRTRDLEEV